MMLLPIVIHENNDYLVIDKPAGLLVHQPNKKSDAPTVVSWLLEHYPQVKDVGDEPAIRPGIVHRLDREVSGVMVIARSQAGFNHLKQQFQDHGVGKKYLGLVYGQLMRSEGEINLPLARGPNRTIVKPRGAEDRDQRVKSAVTYFEVIKRYQHYSLLMIEPKTGRTNQIRAHLMVYGHSIVGDTKYCHPRWQKRTGFTKFIKSVRVFLHASELSFADLEGERRVYQSPLPADLQAFLDTLT